MAKKSAHLNSRRILIVDDDDGIRSLLECILREEGYQTQSAEDGVEALKQVSGKRPDLVMLDLMMPRCNGFDVIKRLQKGDTAAIPVIVLTGRYMDTATENMLRRESNVFDFLKKPVDAAEICRSARKALKLFEAD